MEAQPEDSEESLCPPSSFMSSPAENVDDEHEGLDTEAQKLRFQIPALLFVFSVFLHTEMHSLHVLRT